MHIFLETLATILCSLLLNVKTISSKTYKHAIPQTRSSKLMLPLLTAYILYDSSDWGDNWAAIFNVCVDHTGIRAYCYQRNELRLL